MTSPHVTPADRLPARTVIIHGRLRHTSRSSVTRGKVAGWSRPCIQERFLGSVERWQVDVGNSIFHSMYGRLRLSSGGASKGFIRSLALTVLNKNGSRTGPSNKTPSITYSSMKMEKHSQCG